MLSGKMGHQSRGILYHPRQPHRSKICAEEKSEWGYPFTCIAQRSFPREHHSPTPFCILTGLHVPYFSSLACSSVNVLFVVAIRASVPSRRPCSDGERREPHVEADRREKNDEMVKFTLSGWATSSAIMATCASTSCFSFAVRASAAL
jgi:hypothetical protein